MNIIELDQALRKLRLSGMADVLENAPAAGPDRADGAARPRRGARQR